MITVSKSKLKAHMLQIFREIEKSGEEIIVTDQNKPTLCIRPIAKKLSVDEVFGSIDGRVEYYEDINAPTKDEWGEA